MYELHEILSTRVLTRRYQQAQQNHRENPFRAFMTPTSEELRPRISGTEYQYIWEPGENRPAPMNTPDQPAHVLSMVGISEKTSRLWRSFNSLPFKGDALRMLREYDSESIQRMGREEIRRQISKFALRHAIQKNVLCSHIFTRGIVYLDNQGNFLESSSGANMTVDYGIPAEHKGNCDGIFTDMWHESDTSIITQLDKLKEKAEKEDLPPPKHVWLNGARERAWIRRNAEILSYADGNLTLLSSMMRGEIVMNIGGYQFHFFAGTYQAADNSRKPYIPEGKAIITADPNEGWLEAPTGSEIISKTIDISLISPDLEAANPFSGELEEVFGTFAYVKMADNPVRMELYTGDNYGWTIKNYGFWIADIAGDTSSE